LSRKTTHTHNEDCSENEQEAYNDRPDHVTLSQGLPTWGACTPRGTFKVNNRRGKYIYILFIYKYLHIYQ